MRARTFGLAMLGLVGIAPLAVFGRLAITRSERTAVDAVRAGNRRLAKSIAKRISAFGDSERVLLGSVGAAALAAEGGDPQAVLEAYALGFPNFHDLSVTRLGGPRVEAALARTEAPEFRVAEAMALSGRSYESRVATADRSGAGPFAHTVIAGEPVVIAGKLEGAIVARIDLVDVWEPVNSVRVGRSGFVRLLTFGGTLLAHGDPEERRYVFNAEGRHDEAIVAAALLGETARNQRGEEVVASVAFVPGRDWIVVVEQPVSEAYAAARAMKWQLLALAAGVLVVVILCGVLFGRTAVRSLERLRAHTHVLASGNLDARIDTRTPLEETRALAESLNEMAGSLKKLHDEARNRERLSTFARVAAGLAHDLRNPIEAVRTAAGRLAANPDDVGARELFRWVNDIELPKLKRYMDDLQRLAREGNVQLDVAEVVPRALADQVVADLKSNPKWRGVAFSADGDAGELVVDANLVKRAVYNLATNAADACATRGPGGRVWIEVGEANGAGRGAVTIRVCDTGGGIAAEHLANLLEGDFTSTKRSTGVGLGFGVARHVAQAHGGRIDGESKVGEGSAFTLVLPRRGGAGNGKDSGGAKEGKGLERDRMGATSLQSH